MTTTCAVRECMRPVSYETLCAPCALTFLLTPGGRAQGEALRSALRDFVVRQDVRNHLRGQSA